MINGMLAHPDDKFYSALAKRLQIENPRQNCSQDIVFAVGSAAVLRAAVVPIFIAAPEALAEVVVVITLIYVVSAIAVARVLIRIGVLVAGVIAILPVCLPRAKSLLIPVVDGLTEQVGAVLIRFERSLRELTRW